MKANGVLIFGRYDDGSFRFSSWSGGSRVVVPLDMYQRITGRRRPILHPMVRPKAFTVDGITLLPVALADDRRQGFIAMPDGLRARLVAWRARKATQIALRITSFEYYRRFEEQWWYRSGWKKFACEFLLKLA